MKQINKMGAQPGGSAGVQTFPASVDVAIIGGGIIGLSTALELARQGVRVAVFEKGELAGEQSSRNWGWIRSLARDPKELPLAALADQAWVDIQSQVDVGYRRTGLAYLAQSEAEMAKHATWAATARDLGYTAELLGSAALKRQLPNAARSWAGALYGPNDGVAEPSLAAPAIARLATDAGAMIYTQCAVRGVDVAAGRVTGVVTEHGVVRCNAAVMAGGAWSRLLCGNHGIEFPQLKVRASVMRTHPIDAGLDLTINGGDFTCRKRSDGGYTVSQAGASTADLTPDSIRLFRQFMPAWLAERKYLKLRVGQRFIDEWKMPRRFSLDQATPFEACRTLNPEPAMKMVDGALENLKAALPSFAKATVAHAWAGMIDVTPDALPVISGVGQLPGFYLASGFSAHGFGIGPAAGALMADIVRGVTPRVNAEAFRLSRFTER
jgi:glycine/D-amino acid oxidase-like deaminating enzyme